MNDERIAFKVEFTRILELLADQIYQSPLALLRENTQNAFDAVRMRQRQCDDFEPEIRIIVDNASIDVSDNGIGMTKREIEENYWYAGRSGKNTEAAREAGVVGTFGIGAMANFGVAEELSVDSESFATGERTYSHVRKSDLSTETAGILIKNSDPKGVPGTSVHANLAETGSVSVDDAKSYLRQFVEFVNIPVYCNDELISGADYRSILPSTRHAWKEVQEDVVLGGITSANLEVTGMASGELRIVLENVRSSTHPEWPGTIVLLQNRNVLQTMRYGFGLANVALPSRYRWGGIVDLPLLRPTAGREALDDSSTQLLQRIISDIDSIASSLASQHPECLNNDGFLQWVLATNSFDVCGPMEITLRPSGESETLDAASRHIGIRYYDGRDSQVIQDYASEDEPLIVLSRRSPRRECERGYLSLKHIPMVDTTPTVTQELDLNSLSFAHVALSTRVARILEDDYFLENNVCFGSISGGLPLLVTNRDVPVTICLDPTAPSVDQLLSLYKNDFDAFNPFVKDFVRSSVFPRISNIVPTSTRQGAESFLRHLRSRRELFEYELEDRADLEEIFEELLSGKLSVREATRRLEATGSSVVEVSRSGTGSLDSVVRELDSITPDEGELDTLDPVPGIDRRDQETESLILTTDEPFNGYSCFLSISDRVQREKGEFFLHPHSTQVIWGGQKVLFIFQHHSRRFGLYYDILCPGLVEAESGGGPQVTSTILAKNRTFIPLPRAIENDFLPKSGERKRLEVRCDILYLAEQYTPTF